MVLVIVSIRDIAFVGSYGFFMSGASEIHLSYVLFVSFFVCSRLFGVTFEKQILNILIIVCVLLIQTSLPIWTCLTWRMISRMN
jgi:hypothetical protein